MSVPPGVRNLEQRRARVRVAILLVTAALIVLALPSSAGAFVYWINWNHTTAQGSIGRANLDGTGANQNFITFPTGLEYEPHGVAVDGSHIYWAHGAIGRANLDGTGVDESFITPSHNAFAVAVDGSHVYWGGSDVVGRADLGGTNVSDIAGCCTENIQGIAVYNTLVSGGGHIYYADRSSGEIGRANLDGSQDDPNFIFPAGLGLQPQWLIHEGVAVNATGIYWPSVNGSAMAIGHASAFGPPFDAGNVNMTAILNTGPVYGVAVDDTHIYYGTTSGVGRANLDGLGVEPNLITGGTGVRAVAVDASAPRSLRPLRQLPRARRASLALPPR